MELIPKVEMIPMDQIHELDENDLGEVVSMSWDEMEVEEGPFLYMDEPETGDEWQAWSDGTWEHMDEYNAIWKEINERRARRGLPSLEEARKALRLKELVAEDKDEIPF